MLDCCAAKKRGCSRKEIRDLTRVWLVSHRYAKQSQQELANSIALPFIYVVSGVTNAFWLPAQIILQLCSSGLIGLEWRKSKVTLSREASL